MYAGVEGVIRFRRVKIIDENETQVCVRDLTNGLPIVTVPRNGLEGMPASVKKP